MFINKFIKKLIVFGGGVVLFFSLCTIGNTAGPIAWKELETKHTIIKFQSHEDLASFSNKLDSGFSSLFGSQSWNSSREVKLKQRVDSIYSRVQTILDMRRSTKKVIIQIYKNKPKLHQAYYDIYRSKRKLRAWYIYERKTIYISTEDVFAGMLAHEMAHHIIDHYLAIRPPGATAEILARYVDSHLAQ